MRANFAQDREGLSLALAREHGKLRPFSVMTNVQGYVFAVVQELYASPCPVFLASVH